MQKKKMQKKLGGGGVCLPAPGGGCLLPGGVCSGGWVSQHALRQTPWTESQTPVKTLPWPNFVAGGNYQRNLTILNQ